MSGHTPTPWFVVNRGTDQEPMISVMAARIAGQPPRHEVAICATGDSPQAMETANAAYIVRACNAMGDLEVLANEFRPSMDAEVLLQWAEDVIATIRGDAIPDSELPDWSEHEGRVA